MIVSMMQPYFFPYIGYFQLIANADVFVFLDDVQYIKRGWVNRNRILKEGMPDWFILPVLQAPHEYPINQRVYQLTKPNLRYLARRIEATYAKAPQFPEVFPLLQRVLGFDDANVARFNINSLEQTARFIGLDTKFITSSELVSTNDLKGEKRVIDLCRRLGTLRYINPIGGISLYHTDHFRAAGMDLAFLESIPPPYSQFGREPVPSLSIIDVMMFNDVDAIRNMLPAFRLHFTQ